MQPEVIPYKRFSGMRQERGDSLRRQAAAAEAWAAARGWQLSERQPTDRGRSGYTGANRHKGALGEILRLIEARSIKPGSYLLIERLDRLTREEVFEALGLMRGILAAGVIIVTLNDGKEYDSKSLRNTADLLYSVLMLAQGHEESAKKGERVHARFEQARKTGSKAEFGSAPGWLTRSAKNEPWTVIEERAAVVRRVFELAASGWGSKAIAQRANAEGWTLPTRDTKNKKNFWHGSVATRLLNNTAVIGKHEHRIQTHEAKQRAGNKGEATGRIIEDYYPAIISNDLWHRARAATAARKQKRGRRGEHYNNIWNGLLKCGKCGETIERKITTKGTSRAQLTCRKKIAGACDAATAAAAKTEPTLLYEICAIAGAAMGIGADKEATQNEITIAKSKLAETRQQGENIAAAIAAVGAIPEMLEKARALKEERAALEAQIEAAQRKLSEEPLSMLSTDYADSVMALLYEKSTEAKELRAECNEKLRRAVEEIALHGYDCAIVKYKTGEQQLIALPTKTKNQRRPYLESYLELSKGRAGEEHKTGDRPQAKGEEPEKTPMRQSEEQENTRQKR